MARPRIRVGALTDVGRTRDHNEDAFGFREAPDHRLARQRGDLFLVCDGMGGHAAGEVASALAVETILDAYYDDSVDDPVESLTQAIKLANARIFQQSSETQEQRGMGTTCVASALIGDRLVTAHAGDSRAYLIRNGEIVQITRDHSLVQKWVTEGLLPPEEARDHPMVNVITRALGHSPDVEVDVSTHPLYQGDTLILCSDGLSGRVTDDTIRSVVVESEDLDIAAQQLIDAANAAGGPDNISVVLVRIEQFEPESEPIAVLDADDTAPGNVIPDDPATERISPIDRNEPATDPMGVGRIRASQEREALGNGEAVLSEDITPATLEQTLPGARVGAVATPRADAESEKTAPRRRRIMSSCLFALIAITVAVVLVMAVAGMMFWESLSSVLSPSPGPPTN